MRHVIRVSLNQASRLLAQLPIHMPIFLLKKRRWTGRTVIHEVEAQQVATSCLTLFHTLLGGSNLRALDQEASIVTGYEVVGLSGAPSSFATLGSAQWDSGSGAKQRQQIML